MSFIPMNGGGALSETVLWTNANPSTSFSSLTANLSDNINNYQYIKIVYKGYRTDSTSNCRAILATPSDWGGGQYARPALYAVYSSKGYVRQASKTDTSFTFTASYQMNAVATDNNTNIPYQIIGLK